MNNQKHMTEDFDAFDCSSASNRPAWWPDDWEWPPKLSNEPEFIDKISASLSMPREIIKPKKQE